MIEGVGDRGRRSNDNVGGSDVIEHVHNTNLMFGYLSSEYEIYSGQYYSLFACCDKSKCCFQVYYHMIYGR